MDLAEILRSRGQVEIVDGNVCKPLICGKSNLEWGKTLFEERNPIYNGENIIFLWWGDLYQIKAYPTYLVLNGERAEMRTKKVWTAELVSDMSWQ